MKREEKIIAVTWKPLKEKKGNKEDLDRSFLELGVMSSKEYLKIELKGGTGQNISVCLLYKPKSDRRFQVEF